MRYSIGVMSQLCLITTYAVWVPTNALSFALFSIATVGIAVLAMWDFES